MDRFMKRPTLFVESCKSSFISIIIISSNYNEKTFLSQLYWLFSDAYYMETPIPKHNREKKSYSQFRRHCCSAIKRSKLLMPITTWINTKTITLHEGKNKHKVIHSVWLHLHEILRKVKLLETKSISMIARVKVGKRE